jgi:hypothetical protein
MSTVGPQEYKERTESAPPFQMHVASYRLGEVYYCSVDNVDPGAVIARSEGATRTEAESKAIAHAQERLKRTRVQ